MDNFTCTIRKETRLPERKNQYSVMLSVKRDNGSSVYRFYSDTRVRALAEVFNIISEKDYDK